MSDEDMIVDMQMSLSTSGTISYYLFKSFTITNGGTFFAILLLTIAMAFTSEAASYFLDHSKKATQNILVYFALRTLQYAQMLVVMTFNVWVILVLVAAQTGFMILFKIKAS